MKKVLASAFLAIGLLLSPLSAAQAATHTVNYWVYTPGDWFGGHWDDTYQADFDVTNVPSTTANTITGNVDFSSLHQSRHNPNVYRGTTTDGQVAFTLTLDNAGLVTGDVTGKHLTPYGTPSGDTYLSVYGCDKCAGSATFTFDKAVKSISFLWGSVDSYNYLDVYNAAGTVYRIFGSDLLTEATANGTLTEYFSLYDAEGIVKLILYSCSNSFEISSMTVAEVPLPGTLGLFLAGLLGLVGFRRKMGFAV